MTKERDMLRRDQSRKGESTTLLKEKDEMIKQVMAEGRTPRMEEGGGEERRNDVGWLCGSGEELSRKQAAQEAQMKKLRSQVRACRRWYLTIASVGANDSWLVGCQVREHEESEQRLTLRIESEEAKVEALKRDKSASEATLQEAVERSQAEAATQKEYFSTALAESKAALAAAEARVDSEAKAGLDRRLKDSSERERALVRSVDELRQTLSRAEQQAAFREDMLRQEVEDLERRCQVIPLPIPPPHPTRLPLARPFLTPLLLVCGGSLRRPAMRSWWRGCRTPPAPCCGRWRPCRNLPACACRHSQGWSARSTCASRSHPRAGRGLGLGLG